MAHTQEIPWWESHEIMCNRIFDVFQHIVLYIVYKENLQNKISRNILTGYAFLFCIKILDDIKHTFLRKQW